MLARPFFAWFEPVQSQQVAFMVLVLLCIETCFTQVNSVGIWLADPVTRSVNQIRTFFTNIRKSKEEEAKQGVVWCGLYTSFQTTIFKHDILKYAILGGGKIDFWSKLTILTKWDYTISVWFLIFPQFLWILLNKSIFFIEQLLFITYELINKFLISSCKTY